MMNNNPYSIPQNDGDILRQLGEHKARLAEDPVNRERRAAWLKHDAGTGGRVMVLAEHGAVMDQNRPQPDSDLRCESEWARGIEKSLRSEIYQFETLKDDHVIEPRITTNWKVTASDYGVQAVVHQADNAGHLGSRSWEPPIEDLDRDFAKLKPRTFSVDREATLREKAALERVFAGILDVQIRGAFYWTMGLTWCAIDLVGLQNLWLYMCENPEGVHRLMAFLRDDHIAFAQWLEREGLYTLNNENDYIGSGSMGYTKTLPRADCQGSDRILTKDLWVLSESQETVGVGPAQFEEFVFPYQLSIVEMFGKTYYGCCEPVDSRWQILKRVPNLARVSVSPWADEGKMAEGLGSDYVYSRKPNPTMISTGRFDEKQIRQDLRKTLTIARGCRLEIIMKDVHTLHNEPERLPRWVEIAREEIEKGR
jgi:hypothetical protein